MIAGGPLPRAEGGRVEALDGLRAVAALMVVAYHAGARWAPPQQDPTLYPYGGLFAGIPGIGYFGSFGVLLFFMISGFVIMMTLERTSGIADFAARRIARLWPCMLVCATLSALVINTLGQMDGVMGLERFRVTPLEYFSSIVFFPPAITADLLGAPPSQWVEGVYWTLWAEVRFYALIALVYLIAGRARFLWAWAGVQACSLVADALISAHGGGAIPFSVQQALQPDMLQWFTLGLCAFHLYRGHLPAPGWIASGLALAALVVGPIVTLEGGAGFTGQAASYSLFSVLVILPFALFIARSPVIDALAWKPLVTLGLASYPLYLFHERPSLIFTWLFTNLGLPPLVALALALALVIGASLLIYRLVEQPGKRLLTGALRPAGLMLEARAGWLRFDRVRSAA